MTPKAKEQQITLLNQHYAPRLSKKAIRQMKTAVSTPKNRMFRELLFPQIIADAEGGTVSWLEPSDRVSVDAVTQMQLMSVDDHELINRPSYMCMSGSALVPRRSQLPVLSALEAIADDTNQDLERVQHQQTYFTNHMRWWAGEEDEYTWPSERSVLGPVTVLTLEFDPPNDWTEEDKLSVFEAQLGWLRRAGDGRNTQPIEAVLQWVKGFSDFRALCVAYSGGKGFHFHFAFDTSDLCASHPHLRDMYRPAYKAAHVELSDAFTRILPLKGLQPDPKMNEPERVRRLPNGTRRVSCEGKHLFGVPSGTDVLQAVLFEEVLQKAPIGASKRMFDPLRVEQLAHSKKEKCAKGVGVSTIGCWRTQEEHDFWISQANSLLAKHSDPTGFPRASHFETYGGSVVLKLFASEDDQNAGGIMFENSNSPIFSGGEKPNTRACSGLPLVHYLRKWQRQWARDNPDAQPEDDLNQTVTPIVESQITKPDIIQSRQQVRDEIWSLSQKYQTVLVKGPTGFGKTYTLLQQLPDLVQEWRKRELAAKEAAPSFELDHVLRASSAVATLSYAQAQEKCDQFNALHDQDAAVGIVFRSFDQVYSEALVKIYGDNADEQKFTIGTASRAGQRSVMSAIRYQQPDVWQCMADLHAEMLRPFKDAPVNAVFVLFTVHGVLHQWSEGGLSRLLSHPDFFDTDVTQLWTLHDHTKLVVAVQDELSDADLLHLYDFEMVRWCEELFVDDRDVWSSEFIHLSEAYHHWKNFKGTVRIERPKFDDVLQVHRSKVSSAHRVGVGPLEAYCHDRDAPVLGLYKPAQDHSYAYQKRSWWTGLAHHTFLLTTEHLPTLMFQSATSTDPSVVVYDIGCGAHPDGIVEVRTLATLQSTSNHQLAVDVREELPDAFVVANKVAEIDCSLPPVTAKGVNDLADENILQIMNFLDPTEYARLQIINMLYGLQTSIRMRHVDQFNQTAGRNLGCRYRGKRHIAYMPDKLWKFLLDGSISEFGFQINEVKDASQRRDRKMSKIRQENKLLEREAEEIALYEAEIPIDQMIEQWVTEAGLTDADPDQGCLRNAEQQDEEWCLEDA